MNWGEFKRLVSEFVTDDVEIESIKIEPEQNPVIRVMDIIRTSKTGKNTMHRSATITGSTEPVGDERVIRPRGGLLRTPGPYIMSHDSTGNVGFSTSTDVTAFSLSTEAITPSMTGIASMWSTNAIPQVNMPGGRRNRGR